MEAGDEAPEPADRGGAGLPRRVDPQVPRRQRGYYVGGARRDDGGYFALLPEQEYGGAGGDDRGYFAPAPEEVYGEHRAPLAEGIPFRVPRPGGSPGRDGPLPFARGRAGHLTFARGRAPPALLEDALGRAPDHGDDITRAGGGQVDALGAPGRPEGPLGDVALGAGGQVILPVGAGRGGAVALGARGQAILPVGAGRGGGAVLGGAAVGQAIRHPPRQAILPVGAGRRGAEALGFGGQAILPIGAGREGGAVLGAAAVGQAVRHPPRQAILPVGAGRRGAAALGFGGQAILPVGAGRGGGAVLGAAAVGQAVRHPPRQAILPVGAGRGGAVALGAGGQAILPVGAGHGGGAVLGAAAVGQAFRHPPRQAKTEVDLDLRANRNHPDRKGNQLMNLDKKQRTGIEVANHRNEDLLDLIASLEKLKDEINAEQDKFAVKKKSKAYKGALAKAMRFQREISRAGGVPRPIPPKLLVLPSP